MERTVRRFLVVTLALALGPLAALRPLPVAADDQAEDFRIRLYEFAGALDSLAEGQAPSLQQEILAAEPDVIVFLRDALAQHPAWNQVDTAMSATTMARSAVAGGLDICAAVAAGGSPPLSCPLTAPPGACPSPLLTVPATVGLRITAQAFQGVAIVAHGVCDINPNTFNLITKGVVAVACAAAGVAEIVVAGIDLTIGKHDICGGGEKEAEIQRSILASLVSTEDRIDRLGEQAAQMQAILDRETEISLRSGPSLVSLQLPAQVVDCLLTSECLADGLYRCAQLDRTCECSNAPGRGCSHDLDCAAPRKICAVRCQRDADCGGGGDVSCSVLPSGGRICDDPATVALAEARVCTTEADCNAGEVCVPVEVGGRLDTVVDLVRKRIAAANIARLGNVPGAFQDFNTARDLICDHEYRRAFNALASAYTKITND